MMYKKIMSIVVVFVLCFCLGTSVFAADDAINSAENAPAPSATEQIDGISAISPIGTLTDEECELLLSKERDIQTRHFSLTPHVHEITEITSQYVGQRDRGIVNQTTERVNTTSHLVYERQRTVSNNWSVSISFSDDIVSGELGYDVGYSDTATASYILDIPANKMGSITLYDMYDVTTFNVKTTWIYTSEYGNPTHSYEYGTGWAEQWTHFGYSGDIW